MPYAKVLPIRSAKALSGKIAYLTNANHVNHTDKIVEAASCHRIQSAAEFLSKTVSTIRGMNARSRRGRKIRNLADEIIIRLPDLANVTAQERATFLETTIADFCPDSPAYGVWHLDKYNGSADLHLIVSNFIDSYPPKTRRSSAFNPIAIVRASSDRITDIINARRREQGGTAIITMRDVRKNRIKQRGMTTLAEQLAPLQPFSSAELPEKIASLGHKVTRYNAKANTVSVCLDGGKKAHRFFVDKLLAETASLGGDTDESGGGMDIAGVSTDIEIS